MNKNLICIKIFPALNGDCILIEILGVILLVDGGYVSTYKKFLKPELLKLANEKRAISHIVVTHIDGDHISGINSLIEENLKNQFIQINNIWHNSFRHIQNFHQDNDNYHLRNGKKIEGLEIRNNLKDEINEDKNISAAHGSTLANLIAKSKYNWNSEFKGKAVSKDNLEMITISKDVKIRLLSPDNEKLKDLYKYWQKELFKMGYNFSLDQGVFFDDAFEYIVTKEKEKKVLKPKDISYSKLDVHKLSELDFDEDNAISNGSSISFILEIKNIKLLFLADSHPKLIIESLRRIYDEKLFPIKFDLIKVSHHGSIANTSKDLLKIIDSEKYIFSTNGISFNHPDIETIARIINRKTNFRRTLYFNYPVPIIEEFNTPELKNEFNFDCVVQNGSLPVEISL